MGHILTREDGWVEKVVLEINCQAEKKERMQTSRGNKEGGGGGTQMAQVGFEKSGFWQKPAANVTGVGRR